MCQRTNDGRVLVTHCIPLFVATMIVLTLIMAASTLAQADQKVFSSSQDAVNAFIDALKADNNQQLLAIFGSDANDLITSGDPVADRTCRQRFVKAYDQRHRIDAEDDKLILVVGENDWPFPIPIVRRGKGFLFDTDAGKDEILCRRVGRNELCTIQVMLAIVDAQREYAMKDNDNDGLLEYARKFKSDPGEKNGLYWETGAGEEPSPLGNIVAQARLGGYLQKESTEEPSPYHGYFYRILTAQGPNASGGEFDYIVNGKMIGGFAVVAYPAEYGNSGVMTFIVNHDGDVYQKDLGPDTQTQAQAMKLFDPDDTWTNTR